MCEETFAIELDEEHNLEVLNVTPTQVYKGRYGRCMDTPLTLSTDAK